MKNGCLSLRVVNRTDILWTHLLLLHLFSVANLLMPNARNVPDSLIFKTCYGNLKRSVRQPDLLSCKTFKILLRAKF